MSRHFLFYIRKPQRAPAGGYRSSVSCHSYFDRRQEHTRSFGASKFIMAEKQRKWDNHQACIKCRGEKKGKDKCVSGKEADYPICAASLKVSHKKKSKSKSSQKFDDSLLDEPTPSKSSQSNPSIPDTSLQDLIKNMSSQLASLTSQFEEFK